MTLSRRATSVIAATLAVAASLSAGSSALAGTSALARTGSAHARRAGTLARATQPADAAPTAPPSITVDLHLSAHPTAADLTRVEHYVAALTKQANAAAASVNAAASREAYLDIEVDQARANAAQAQSRLDAAVRTAYEAGGGNQTLGFLAGISPADTEETRQATASTLQVDSSLVANRERAGESVTTLSGQADAARRALLNSAGPVEAAEGKAEAVLDAATKAFAADQAAEAALAAQRAALAATSEQVAFAVTPAETAMGQAAAAAQAPILALLDRTPSNAIPAGYHQTGKSIDGLSSWYGPGFVGRNTSSGSPYDPEQLTCAMLAVPLGTLVRVSTAAGGVVTVLVTDHGPYVGPDRIIDLSERAAAIAGVGLTPVNVEVLEPNAG